LVIKAARPPIGLSERLLGSTDMHLLRKCPCPVLVERQDALPAYRRVLAAVDPVSRGTAMPLSFMAI
uniref:universal stress protein n=1 Tax=Phaeobacter italicus TaxID=481446 RepID=UPI0031E6540E